MRFAYFAKYSDPITGECFWVCVSTNCSGDDVNFYDKHFITRNNYIRTKVLELD